MNDELNRSWDKFYRDDEKLYEEYERAKTQSWVHGMYFGTIMGFVITCVLVGLWGWLFVVPGY